MINSEDHSTRPQREQLNSPPRVSVTLGSLVEEARALIVPGERRILGIAGAPGAGKSTIAAALADALAPDAVVVEMDGFHLSNEELASLARTDRKGAVDTFDSFGYAALLERLKTEHETIYVPVFNREIEQSIGSAKPVQPDTHLIITEGNYLLSSGGGWARARRVVDQIWYLEVSREERRRRLVRRHQLHGRAAADAEAWVERVDLVNGELIEEQRSRADVIIEVDEVSITSD